LEALRGWAYAHRGLHGDGVPENSMEAFRRAKEAGFGVELDIHLLADGNLAVIHDSLLVRTTGAQGRIEDLTTDQLSAYRLEETEQTIPEFRQVLELFAGQTPLIIELKCVGNNYPQLCQTACDMLEHYPGPYCMESFDPRCVRWLCKNRPDIVRGQLSENYFLSNTAKLPWVLKLLLSFQMLNFLLKPDFVAYRYAHLSHFSNFFTEKVWGAQSVTWTLKTKEEYDKATSEGRIPIFEGFLP
jgi:glycerophosphoryl diester phosphodiesterase